MDLKDFLSQKQKEQLKQIIIETSKGELNYNKYLISGNEKKIKVHSDNYFKKPKTDIEIKNEKYKTIIDYLYSA